MFEYIQKESEKNRSELISLTSRVTKEKDAVKGNTEKLVYDLPIREPIMPTERSNHDDFSS